MPIIEGLITNAISEILKVPAEAALDAVLRNEKVVKVRKALGLNPDPKPTFKSVYTHALIEFGIGKSGPLLEFFRHEDTRKAFFDSFTNGDRKLLAREADTFLDWNKVGDDLRKKGIDPRLEFAGFTFLFNEMIDRTRTPAQARQEGKVDAVLRLLGEGNLDEIRGKNLEVIQGGPAEQLREWFATLGYSFGQYEEKNVDYTEWIVKIPARRGYDCILVRFVERRKAEAEDLEGVRDSLTKRNADEGWVVSALRKSQAAEKMAEKNDALFCYTFDELIEEHADFSRYFHWLEEFVKKREIEKNYIPLACRRDLYHRDTKEKHDEERYGEKEGWTEGYINQWLDEPCKEHISILGEFGTGKTWFTHYYAYATMREYLKARKEGRKRPRIPLVVQLRDYAKAMSIESLFSEFIFHKHEIRLPGYSAFEQLNRMGKLLLIFDGFDEMADKLDRQKMIDNFWEIARTVVPGAKVILSCRTEYFPNAIEGRSLLNAELTESTKYSTGESPQFEILDLAMFDQSQIRAALMKRTDEKTVDLIMAHPELIDLAARPVMLEFLLEALPDIEAGKPVDLSRIYLYAIRQKLERDFRSERTFTSMADKVYFMCELSREMLLTGRLSLNYRRFPDRMKSLFGPLVGEEKDLDHWKFDMMGNSLLTRNDDGDYSPAHKSLLEFFVAYRAVAGLGVLPDDFTEAARSRGDEDIDKSSEPADCGWDTYFTRETDDRGVVVKIPRLGRFLPIDADGIFNELSGMENTVLRFVHEITNTEETRPSFHRMLADRMAAFRNGDRDPAKEQKLIRFILRFRVLSQQWEEVAGDGEPIRTFWKGEACGEIEAAREAASPETVSLQLSDGKEKNMGMVRICPGSFLMGDEVDGPVHRVDITRPFLLSETQVTQELYSAVMDDNPSEFKGKNLPVEKVTWHDAVRFCNALSELAGLGPAYRIEGEEAEWISGSEGFRLPTEAEWEYGCRAGSTSCFAGGDAERDLDVMGWYGGNTEGKTMPVGEKEPNGWGLCDMHGNVWEWVWDRFGEYPSGLIADPIGPLNGANRVDRGGGWGDGPADCRSASRDGNSPGDRIHRLGFRLSRSVVAPGS